MSLRDRLADLSGMLSEEVSKETFDEDAVSMMLEEVREIIKRRAGTEDLIDRSLLSSLLAIATKDTPTSRPRQAIAESAIRAMMNALFENPSAIELFKELLGPERVFRFIQLELPIRTAYYGVKLLYMLFSSSPPNSLHLLSLQSTFSEMSFSEVIVATFTSCLHPDIDADRKDLFVDCSKLLYAIEHLYQNGSSSIANVQKELLLKLRSSESTLLAMQRQINSVLLRSSRDKNVYLCKLACLQLLVLADKKALRLLCSEEGVVDALVALLHLLLAECQSDLSANENHLITILVITR